MVSESGSGDDSLRTVSLTWNLTGFVDGGGARDYWERLWRIEVYQSASLVEMATCGGWCLVQEKERMRMQDQPGSQAPLAG